MKKVFVLMAAALVATTAFAGKKPKAVPVVSAPEPAHACCSSAVVLMNATDSASYALGVNVGMGFAQNFKQTPGNLDKRIFMQAFKECLMHGDSAKTAIAPEKAQMLLQQFFQQQQELQAKEGQQKEKDFLANNAKRSEVKTTASGLQYEVITEGTGAKPAATDKVKVHYEGKLLDGTVFDSSYKRGEPIEFPLNGVIKGWTEGLQLMPVGSKYILYIPYALGYGERGAGEQIPPYSTLIFTVELLDIVK